MDARPLSELRPRLCFEPASQTRTVFYPDCLESYTKSGS
jgi:hypothetical protein